MKLTPLLLISLICISCTSLFDKDKESAQLYLNLGVSQLRQGHVHLALKSIRKAKQLDSGNAMVFNYLGLTYFTLKKYKRAASNFESAISINSSFTEGRNNLARTLIELRKYKEARRQLRIVLSDLTYTKSSTAQFNYGLSFFRENRYKKSISYYEEFLKSGNKEGLDLIYNDIAWEYESLMDYDSALKYLKLALEENPEEDTLLFEIAYFYEEIGKKEECIDFYNKFLDENPYSFNGWYNLGIVHNDRKEYKKAIFAFDYATVIKDDFASAYFNKGNAHFNLKEYGQALECYYKTFEHEDNQAITFCYIGECYEKLENFEEAEKSFEIALSLNEEIQEALVGMAIIKDKQGLTIESVPFIERANKLYPKNFSCWYIAGEVYNKLEWFEDAYFAYAKADEHDKDDNVQIKLDFSNFIAENLSLVEAIDYLKDYPQIECQYRLVAYHLLLGQHKKAIHLFEQCLTENFEAHEGLLDYHEEINQLPEFISLLNNFR